jgi:hypothetical protein
LTTTTKSAAARAELGLALLLALMIALSLFLVATFGYGRDQGIYAVVARTVLAGGMPYRDAFDFKPPGIYLVYALARACFGAWPHGVRVLEVVGLAATIAGLVVVARRWWGEWRIGLLAGALAALVHAQLEFWHTGQPETFAGMLTVGALVVVSGDERSASRQLLAGVLFGLAGLLKPPLAGGGAALALWLGWRRLEPPRLAGLRARWRQVLAPCLWVLIGGALPFAACLSWFAAEGALGALHHTFFVFTPEYTRLAYRDQNLVTLAYQALTQWLVTFSSGITVGLLLALASWRSVAERQGVGLLLGVVAVQLLGVALQGKFFPYHYAASWPITALVAALGFWAAFRWCAERGARGVAAFAALFVLSSCLRTASKDLPDPFWYRALKRVRVYAWQRDDQAAIDELVSVADVSGRANREVAELLRAELEPGAPIYVWGFEPVLYELCDRPFASRYIYNVPQRVPWGGDAARAELMADLEREPPAAIVVAHHDPLPMVTGNGVDSAEVLEREFAELKAFLTERYGAPTRIEDFEIYLRQGAAAGRD